MNITIYLPDEIAERAKSRKDIILSRILREALAELFEREDTMAKTLDGAKEIVLDLEDHEGRRYKGRIQGTKIAGSDNVEVFLTDENVVVYEPDRLMFNVCEEPESELRDLLRESDYIEAMIALGIEPIVDLAV